jgi:hypothetical protein
MPTCLHHAFSWAPLERPIHGYHFHDDDIVRTAHGAGMEDVAKTHTGNTFGSKIVFVTRACIRTCRLSNVLVPLDPRPDKAYFALRCDRNGVKMNDVQVEAL